MELDNVHIILLDHLYNFELNTNESILSYWKIKNRVMNKYGAPRIPPILSNNLFILDFIEKAELFNDFFSKSSQIFSNQIPVCYPTFTITLVSNLTP